MRNLAGLLSALAIALAALAAPAGADPAKSGGLITEPFDCGGTVMTISHGSGFSGWDIADGQHYVLAFIIYTPWGNAIFGTSPLPAWIFGPLALGALLLLFAEETRKFIVNRFNKSRTGEVTQ